MIDIDVVVQQLELKPGDVLIVKANGPISQETAELITRTFRKAIPEPTKILVIGSEIEITKLSPAA